MTKLFKQALLIIVITCSFLSSTLNAVAFGDEEHDKYLEQVLFGSEDFKSKKSEEVKNVIKALEYASYLALDQYNEHTHPNDKTKIEFLKQRRIQSVPSIEDIDFTGNAQHRRYTHKGWDFSYVIDKAHWEIRKQLLINTVGKELGMKYTGFLWFKKYKDEAKSFAALIYYIHVLGDHIDAKWDKRDTYSEMIHLGDRNYKENSLIEELMKHLDVVFKNQKEENKRVYSGLMREIDLINKDVCEVFHSEGGINSEDEFITYHECAVKLMNLLIERMPILLKNEPFFANVFYSD